VGDVTIRPIEPKDADEFVAVFEAVAAEGRWIGTEAPIPPDREQRIRASIAEPPSNLFVDVAVVGGRLVGFAQAYLEHGRAHLAMAILDGFRGQGIGGRLLDGCISWSRANGAHKVDLEVWPHNVAARRLYERAGSSSKAVGAVTGGATTASCGTRSR
jgi:ribosomal protein S18 acetylase RimI-like enzyme